MNPRLFEQKQALLKKKVLTKSEIYSFKKLFNGLRFMPKILNRNEPRAEEQQKSISNIYELINALAYGTICNHDICWYKISPEQTKQGIEYLRRFCFKADGSLRKGVSDIFYKDHIDIIKDFDKFAFVGFHCTSNQYYDYYTPVYRVYDTCGLYFDYICEHWSKPEVL